MAENTPSFNNTDKRTPIEKRSVNFEKYSKLFVKASYHIGEFTLSLLKQIPSYLLALLVLIRKAAVKLFKSVLKGLKKVAKPFYLLFYKTGRMFRAVRIKAGAAYKSGGIKAMLKAFKKVLKEGAERNRNALIKVRNYVIPAAGIFVLAFTVFVFSQLTFGLIVEYDGVKLGSIRHEQVYNSAEEQLMQRVVYEENDDIEIVPKFILAVVNKDSFLTSDQITDKLIKASSSVIDEATGLYVDNKLVGAVKEKDKLEKALDSILSKYKSDDPDEIVAFVKDVQIKDGLYPVSSIVDFKTIEEKINGENSAEIVYTVSSGDTPYTVAQRAGISLSTFYSLNPITKTTFVIGQKVTIASSEPFLSVKVQRYQKVQEKVEHDTITTKNNNYYTSYRKVTRKGVDGVNEVTYLVTYLNGVATEKEITETKVISKPIDEKVTVGTKVASTMVSQSRPSSTGNGKVPGFIWPTSGRISCRWWGYYNHRGLDIAAPRGTPIYAAAGGTVISYKNQRNGYGRHIVIDHGNGVQTLYAHTDAVYVSVGQRVTKGQKVAAVGRTGWATGYHLHFGVMINGVYKNPELYLP